MLHLAASNPLSAHVLFQSNDLDEARERVAAVFCPHRLDTIGRGAQMAARHNHLRGENLSLNYIEYGAKTRIAPGELGSFYLLQIPLRGGAAVTNGNDHYYSTPDAAAVLNPHVPTTMIWEEGTKQVLVQINRQAMQDHLSAQLGHPLTRPPTFTGALDLTTGPGAALRRLVLHLVAEADAGAHPIGPGQMAQHFGAALMAGLLAAHQHDYRSELGLARPMPRPRHLRLAEAYIDGHLDGPVAIDDIARAAGLSSRAVQLLFRQHHGTTPLGFWRGLRLARAHSDLVQGHASVTDIALKWGFSHFGRFSESYRQRYGQSPSASRRGAGGRGAGGQ